jgi:hypothetical protein
MTTWVSAPGPATAPIGLSLSTGALVVAVLARRWTRKKIREGVDRGGVLLGLATALVIVSMLCLSAVMPVWDHQRTFRPVGDLVRSELAAGRRVALAVPDRNVIGAMIMYADARLPVVSLVPGAQDFLMEDDRPRGVLIRVEDADSIPRPPGNAGFGMRAVPDGAGYLSRSYRLITRD